MPWARALRTGIAVVVPVALGAAVGQLGIGLLCSIGALAASLVDPGGPYRGRAARVGTVAAAGTLGFLLGGLVNGNPVLTPILVLAGGVVAGIVSVLGNVASVAGLQFLIYLIVASGANFGPAPWWLPPALYLVGAMWALALSMAGGIGRRTAPERTAVADVFRALAEFMETSGGSGVEQARVNLTQTMNAAYDSVVSYRAGEAGRDPRTRRLAAVLNASTPIVEAVIGMTRDRAPVPLTTIGRTREIAAAVREGAVPDVGVLAVVAPGGPQHAGTAGVDRIERGLQAVTQILSDTDLPTAGLRSGSETSSIAHRLLTTMASGPETWLPTLRLVLCLACAEFLAALLAPSEHPYWIALTVAVTLKPDFGSVFARAVQRGVGTIVGVALGGALLLVLPGTVWVLIAIGLLAASLPITQRRNYGMFSTFLTPLIVLLLDLPHGGEVQLMVSRILDTTLGCAIVLLVGYVPWPGTWRSRAEFGTRVADAADDVNAYLRVTLGLDPGDRRALRRHAYRRLSDLRTLLQQALAEPPLVSRQAAAWWPVIVALERVLDAVTAFAVDSESAVTPPVEPGDAQNVARFATALSARIRGQQAPEGPLPEDGPLAGIAEELRTAAAVVAGPVAA